MPGPGPDTADTKMIKTKILTLRSLRPGGGVRGHGTVQGDEQRRLLPPMRGGGERKRGGGCQERLPR